MNPRNLPVPAACFSALILFAGCAGLQVSGYLQQGRNALRAGKPATAVSYLRSAADLDPNYHAPDPFHGSVLTYLGRAYYETGILPKPEPFSRKRWRTTKKTTWLVSISGWCGCAAAIRIPGAARSGLD